MGIPTAIGARASSRKGRSAMRVRSVRRPPVAQVRASRSADGVAPRQRPSSRSRAPRARDARGRVSAHAGPEHAGLGGAQSREAT
ncbi:hypothetical protein DF032_21745 [Burkholderia seminalis]|nr:hypothetical protein DF032_21745 [Burkholderia seminalis]